MKRLISGGQTGVDRGALDAAIELGIPHGGHCPSGRRAEDGTIPPRYRLDELASRAYEDRTKRNVRDADATLIVCRGALSGGTALTKELCARYHKPCLVVDLDALDDDTARRIRAFADSVLGGVLNVAGPRESECPGIQHDTLELLRGCLADVTP